MEKLECAVLNKFVVNGGKPLNGEVTISGAKNAAVAIIPGVILCDEPCRIENIPNIKDVQPMSFPFITYEAHLRKDEVILDDTLTVNEVLTNCKHQYNDQVKLPKVVE